MATPHAPGPGIKGQALTPKTPSATPPPNSDVPIKSKAEFPGAKLGDVPISVEIRGAGIAG